MADPHHIPDLDRFDRLTVRLYRIGLLGQAVALLAAWWTDGSRIAWAVYGGFVALAALNMHLYAKVFRWIILGAVLTGLALQSGAHAYKAHWLWHAGLGFLFVGSSAWALKERYCFRIPGMRLVPAFLAFSLTPVFWLRPPYLPFVAIGGAFLTMLAIAKLRMPLHFDVGDKSKYQV